MQRTIKKPESYRKCTKKGWTGGTATNVCGLRQLSRRGADGETLTLRGTKAKHARHT